MSSTTTPTLTHPYTNIAHTLIICKREWGQTTHTYTTTTTACRKPLQRSTLAKKNIYILTLREFIINAIKKVKMRITKGSAGRKNRFFFLFSKYKRYNRKSSKKRDYEWCSPKEWMARQRGFK